MSQKTATLPIAPSLKSILLVEDDKMVSMLMKTSLEKENFEIHQCFRGDKAKQEVDRLQPDLVILDIGLPGLDGFHVCHQIREVYFGPLIVLTARQQEKEQVTALNLGADDYLIKPISPALLKARINALFRRQPLQEKESEDSLYCVGDIEVRPQAHKCQIKGLEVKLSSFEFQLLALLLRNTGRVMTRDAIYNKLLGREYNGTERTVDVRMSRLREKLESNGMDEVLIETVWGKGYILNEKVCVN